MILSLRAPRGIQCILQYLILAANNGIGFRGCSISEMDYQLAALGRRLIDGGNTFTEMRNTFGDQVNHFLQESRTMNPLLTQTIGNGKGDIGHVLSR